MSSKIVVPESAETSERMLEEFQDEKMLDSKMVEMQQLIEYLDTLHTTLQNSSRKMNNFEPNESYDGPFDIDENSSLNAH